MYFVWKFENFDELKLRYSLFFTETWHFPTYQCLQKGEQDFLNFFQILNYLLKLKRPGFYILVFYIFIDSSRSNQNFKNPKNP